MLQITADPGQRRWTIVGTKEFWQKIAQMVCPVLVTALCFTFDEIARVHMINTDYYYSVSLKFPFIYESNVTAQHSPVLSSLVRNFTFDGLLFPSAVTLVAVTTLALLVAMIMFILSIIHHGSPQENEDTKLKFFVSLVMTFMLLAAVCLWLANLIALVQNIQREVDHLLGQCDENGGNCEKTEPNFIPLYCATVFAIVLFLLWLIECIQFFIKMVYTIPAQITLTNLVRNVELDTVEQDRNSSRNQ